MSDNFLKIYNGTNYVPQDADPSNPVDGDIFYASSSHSTRNEGFYTRVGGFWVTMGGGGSGGGNLDLIYAQTFETTSGVGSFDDGNAATAVEPATGTFNSTLEIDTNGLIAGDNSLKLTHVASSGNDFFWNPEGNIFVDPKYRGKEISLTFSGTWDGNDDENEIIFWDDTNGALLTDKSGAKIKARTDIYPQAITVVLKDNTANIRWGVKVNVANSGSILVMDDILISGDPFTFASLEESGYLLRKSNFNTTDGLGSGAGNVILTFQTQLDLIDNEDITYNQDSVNGDTFTINRDGFYSFHLNSPNLNVSFMGFSKNASSLTTDIYSLSADEALAFEVMSGGNDDDSIHWSGQLKEGDIIRCHCSSSFDANSNGSRARLTVSSVRRSKHLIVPSRVNVRSEIIDLTGSGDFTGGSIRVTKAGYHVTIDVLSTITHSASGSAGSATGLIPIWARPSNNKKNVYHVDNTSNIIYALVVLNDGRLFSQYFDAALNTSNQTSSGTFGNAQYSVEVSDNDVTFLAAIPFDQFQTKYLSADFDTDNAEMTDISFSELTIGETYELNFSPRAQANGGQALATIKNGSTIIGIYDQRDEAASLSINNDSKIIKFVATDTTITFTATISGSSLFYGDGTAKETSATLTWKRMEKPTNRW